MATALDLPAGVYHYAVFGAGRTADTTNPSTVAITLAVGASDVATFSAVRSSADVSQYVRFGTEQPTYLPGEAASMTVGGSITFRCTGTGSTTIDARLRIWTE